MTKPDTNGHAPERVALYMRVSSEEQRDHDNIDLQAQFFADYTRLYGLEEIYTYTDDGVSGTIPLAERPEGARLLEDAAKGEFDTLLVYKLDRLGRKLLVTVDCPRQAPRGQGVSEERHRAYRHLHPIGAAHLPDACQLRRVRA